MRRGEHSEGAYTPERLQPSRGPGECNACRAAEPQHRNVAAGARFPRSQKSPTVASGYQKLARGMLISSWSESGTWEKTHPRRRHTEELKSLDTEQAELETLEQLLLTFTKKNLASSASELKPAIPGAQNREDPLAEPHHNGAAPRASKCTIKSRRISVCRSANLSADD